MSTRTVAVNFTANTAPYVTGVRGATAATAGLGASAGGATAATAGLGQAGAAMAARFLGPVGVVMAVKDAANAAMDFEAAALKMQTLVGLTADEMDEMSAAARRVGVEFGVGSQKAVEAAFFISSAGLRGQAAMDALERSAIASALGLGEMATVADLLTSAMNAYGAENLSAARATDILVAGVREGKFEASALAGAIGSVLPTASALGVSFEEVVGILALWSRTGSDVSSSVTSLQAIMSTLMGTTQEGQDLLADYGLSLSDLRDIAAGDGGLLEVMRLLDETFGDNIEDLRKIVPNVRAFRGVMATLAQEGEIVDAVMGNVAESVGMADEAIQKALSEDTRLKVDRLKAAFQDFRIEVGGNFSPAVAAAADALSNMFETGRFQAAMTFNPVKMGMHELTLAFAAFKNMLLDVDDRLPGTSIRQRQAAEAAVLNAQGVDQLIAAYGRYRDGLPAAESGTDALAGALDGLFGATGGAEEAQSALARALGLTNTQLNAQISAVTSLYEEKLALIDPVYAAVRAQRDYESALQDVVDLEAEGKQGSREYVEALLAAELAYFRLQAANAEAGVSMDGYIETLNEAILTGRLTVEQVEGIVKALNDQGHAMDVIDGRVVRTTHVHTVITQGAFEGPTTVVNPNVLEFRARGGPIHAGRAYIVGEEGPELIVPSGSGTVLPAGQTSAAMSGSQFTVYVNMPPGADGDQVVSALRRWERANGPVPVGVR
jgi:TP901 family phage tail tape measure protein